MNIVSDKGDNVGKWDCGLRILYINCEGATNDNIKEYLDLLIKNEILNKKYKITSSIKESLFENGGDVVMKKSIFQEYMNQCIKEGKKEEKYDVIVSLTKEGSLDMKVAAKKLKVSQKKMKELIEDKKPSKKKLALA